MEGFKKNPVPQALACVLAGMREACRGSQGHREAMQKKELGKKGEALALRFLKKDGYRSFGPPQLAVNPAKQKWLRPKMRDNDFE